MGDTLHIRIREAYKARHLVPGLIAAVVLDLALVVIGFVLARDEGLPPHLMVIIVGGSVVFLVLLPMLSFGALTMVSMRRRTVVSVSPRGLGILTWPSLSPKLVVIPVSELEGLEIEAEPEGVGAPGGGEALVARSARARVVFGRRLSHEELVWLRDLIRKPERR
ncbi:MAG: hypothetical protein FJ290_11225 [Planctomycetes bacterium]|nr:hypothetical protein [Planctomycetota bacterium]